MRTLVSRRLAFASVLACMALALTVPGHGPTLPPDPWVGITVSHGPTLPPDPWVGITVSHGPTLPPDPWVG